jgi:UDP-3-O-[3-hydroxymyristoyl] glucosamine N-acyltransferase
VDSQRAQERPAHPGHAKSKSAPYLRGRVRASKADTVAPGFSLGELAARFGCQVQGDLGVRVTHVATLQDANAQALAFVANPKYLPLLAQTRAGAVIVSAENAAKCPMPALIARNPYSVYARIASLLHPPAIAAPGVHPSATIDPTAQIAPSASVGAGCVVEAGARIGPDVVLGPHCIVMLGASIGSQTRLIARVTVCAKVRLGDRCILHPGAVIGSDGFGNAPDAGTWVKIPQLGSVVIGNDVEIGANTTIDRGTLNDTVIEDGVKLDNLIQIAHNVRIGAHTAIAACVGIAGSTTIGKHCVIAGKVGIADQVDICDGVTIMAMTTVGGSIRKPGVYSGAIGMQEVSEFRRNAARFRQLDAMAKELHRLGKLQGAAASAAIEAART